MKHNTFLLGVLLSFLSVLVTSSAFATVDISTGGSVKRGSSTSIGWDVSWAGGCTGYFSPTYPSQADGVKSFWEGIHYGSSTQSITPWGSTTAAFPQTYFFGCDSNPVGIEPVEMGGANLTITDCAASEVWDGSKCTGSVVVTPHTTYGGTSGEAYYNEATAYISWDVGSGTGACDVYRNGVFVISFLNQRDYTIPNVTGTVNYTVQCEKDPIPLPPASPTKTGNTVTFYVPSAPNSLSASCSAPGTSITFNWGMPAAYSRAYIRAYKTPPSSIDYPSACTPQKFAPDGVCTEPYTGSTYSTSSTPGAEYFWYAHTAGNYVGNYSNSVSGGTTTCALPTCAAGTYFDGASCVACTAGNYCAGGNNPPVTCPANYYCTGGNTPPAIAPTPPVACPAGYGSPAGSTNAGQCVLPSGYITSTPASCTIATGDSTCDTLLEWGTTNPVGTSSVTTDTPLPNTVVFTANSDTRLNHVPYNAGGNVMYYLYNNARELASTSVAVSCAAGANKWDTIGGVCANPQVDTALVSGNFYSNPAAIDIICTGSDGYMVYNADSYTATSTGTSGVTTFSASVPIYTPGNYKVICKHGSVEDSQTLYYTYPPGLPSLSINAYPKTIGAGEKSVINWSIKNPPLDTCTLTASAVCTNNVCSSSQEQAAADINTILSSSSTDSNDPGTSRPIVDAVKDLAPGYEADYIARGKKTFTISKNMNFTLDCGGSYRASSRVRVVKGSDQ